MIQAALNHVWETYLKHVNLGTGLRCSLDGDIESIKNGGESWSRKTGELNGRKRMPKGLKDEKRPVDISGAAVPVSRVATGDAEGKAGNAVAKGGEAGGATRAKSETSPRRKEIDKAAASPRWEG